MECNVINILCTLYFMLFVYSTGVESETSEVSFIPSKYSLFIKTEEEHFKDGDTSKMKFEGDVIIDFTMTKPENFNGKVQITLNVNPNMTFDEMVLRGKKGSDYEKIEITHEHKKDKLFININEDVKLHEFQLEIWYKAPFGSRMSGFYRSSYKDSSNKTRWLLTTHFEPIDARNAFPCFDRPDLKAIFAIQITVPSDIKTVLSNTQLDRISEELDFTTFIFKETDIPMSTYLVAFTASNFAATEPVEFQSDYLSDKYPKREIRTYGREDIIKNGDGDFAQSVGIQAINQLTTYLKLGYAFEKIDLLGIPDFSAGAMENWGHISFREKALFVNSQTTPAVTQQSITLTITHELVHQWFGNLVTLKSWDYVWLNEAFANYLEYKMASKFNFTENWNLMSQILINEVHLRAFETDGLNSSFPLNNKITDEIRISPSFNDIPYAKGSAVLRMWDYEFGDKFQKSLQEYLKERKESNSVPSQLYEAFKKEANMNEDTFKTWTDQAGYPVVEVQKKNGTYCLTQTRFFWDKMDSAEIWRIPITYSTDSSKNFAQTVPSHWLHKEPLKLDIKEKIKWIIINNQQAGYYRVNYDQENWNALSKALSEKDHSGIHELNRAQIVNDVFSLARSLQKNYVSYSTALSLAEYLKKDNSYIVWKTALKAFDFLQTKVYKERLYRRIKDYILPLVEPHFKGLNWTSTDHLEKLKNVEISRWACSLDFEPCVKEAKALFKQSTYKKFPDTREIVLCTVIRNDQSVWDSIFDEYKKEENSVLKVIYISALGCTKNETQAKVLLSKTIGKESDIRQQDRGYVLSGVYNGNLKHVDVVFKFIKENYKTIAAEYGGLDALGSALVGISKKITEKALVKELEALADEIQKIPEGKSVIDSLESAKRFARSNVAWLDSKMNQFNDYFSSGSLMSYSFMLLSFCFIFVFQF